MLASSSFLQPQPPCSVSDQRWAHASVDCHAKPLSAAVSAEADQFDDSIQRLYHQNQSDNAIFVKFEHGPPAIEACLPILARCATQKSLPRVKILHKLLAWHGLETCGPVGDDVLSSLIKCGGLDEGLRAFHRLPERTTFSWTAVISGCINGGQEPTALGLYECMKKEGIQPTEYTIVNLLRACGKHSNLVFGRRLHTDAQCKMHLNAIMGNSLISMYMKCESIIEAENVFCELSERDPLSWNLLISAYFDQGNDHKALQLFRQMQEEGLRPTKHTFVLVIQACGALVTKGETDEKAAYFIVEALHANVKIEDHESDVGIGSTLIKIYGKLKSIPQAEALFDGLHHVDVVSWNVMLSAYVQSGDPSMALQLYRRMQMENITPTDRTFVTCFQACAMLAENPPATHVGEMSHQEVLLEIGCALHDDIKCAELDMDVFVGSNLISMYAKCGSMLDAENVFNQLRTRNLVSWTIMLSMYLEHQEAESTVLAFRQMLEEAVGCDARVLAIVLQACYMFIEKQGIVLEICHAINAIAHKMDLDSNAYVGSTLVRLYGKCGLYPEASSIFDTLSTHSVISWNGIMLTYLDSSKAKESLQLFVAMLKEGVHPTEESFTILIKALYMLEDEGMVLEGKAFKEMLWKISKALHSDILASGFESEIFVRAALITMYSRLGSLSESERVFEAHSRSDLTPWASMISAYAENGRGDKVLQLCSELNIESGNLRKGHIVAILHACCILGDNGVMERRECQALCLNIGNKLHGEAKKIGYDTDISVSNAILNIYTRCGEIVLAMDVFNGMKERNATSWNIMLRALVDHGDKIEACNLFKKMHSVRVSPNKQSFQAVLQACYMPMEKSCLITRMQHKEMIFIAHTSIISAGFDHDDEISNSLVNAYGKCNSIMEAEKLFEMMSQPDLISWNVMLSIYDEQDKGEQALCLFSLMHKNTVVPDARSFATVIHACSELGEEHRTTTESGQSTCCTCLQIKHALHSDSQKKHFDKDPYVGASLVSMYGKCGLILEAESAFDSLPDHDTVSWNALFSAYLDQGDAKTALQIYTQMQVEGVPVNTVTLTIAFQACCLLSKKGDTLEKDFAAQIGKALYSDAQSKSFDFDPTVHNAIIQMFCKCGNIDEAENIFHASSRPDIISFNELLAAYIEQGQGEVALEFFYAMQGDRMVPNDVTFIRALQALDEIANVDTCRCMHFAVVLFGYDIDLHIATTLIHTYGMCSSMVDAQIVFDMLPSFDVVSFTALAAGHSREGNCVATMNTFKRMNMAGIKPIGATFAALLRACCHAGLVGEGILCFESMEEDHGIHAEMELYLCLLDLFGRAGDFGRIYAMFNSMKLPLDFALVVGLMNSCQKYGNVQLGKEIFNYIVHIGLKEAATYVLMSNMVFDDGSEC